MLYIQHTTGIVVDPSFGHRLLKNTTRIIYAAVLLKVRPETQASSVVRVPLLETQPAALVGLEHLA